MSSLKNPAKDKTGKQGLILRAFLIACAVEGIAPLTASLSTPSMERRSFLLGYSLPKLLIAAGLGVAILALAGLTLKTFTNRVWLKKILLRANSMLAAPRRYLQLTFSSLYLGITLGFLLFLVRAGFVNGPFILLVAVDRLFGVLCWVTLILFQLPVMLALMRGEPPKNLFTNDDYNDIPILFLVLTTASAQWMLLGLRSSLFYEIPDWFWYFFAPKKIQPASLYIPVISLLSAFGIGHILRNPGRKIQNLLIAIALAYILQIGFGFANGKGFESIRLKYVRTLLSAETRLVCEKKVNMVATVRTYETLYGENFWLGTKPPGLAVFFTGVRELIEVFAPDYMRDNADCLETMSATYAVLFPFIAALTLIPLWGIERLLGNEESPGLSGLLFISAPNFILMTLLRDQFLYPLIFTFAAWMFMAAIRRPSAVSGFITGILIYLTLFVSFSLLPLIGLAAAWIAVELSSSRKTQSTFEIIPSLFGIITGIAVLWLGFHFFLNYNPIIRLQSTLSHHRHIQVIASSPADIASYAFLNNIEFAVWSGAPLMLLAVFGVLRSIKALMKKTPTRRDLFILAGAFTYFVLNAAGQAKAEVGRLWIFILPLAAIAASGEAKLLLKDSRRSFLLVFGLQFITTVLTFFFFDFH